MIQSYSISSFWARKEEGLLLAQVDSLDMHDVFENSESFEDNITRAGKQFLGLHCTPMCSESEGHNCTNISDVHMEFD